MSSLLDDIDVTLEKGNSIAQIKYEETLLPNSEHAFSFFKKTYLDAKDIWLYEYRFECPGILKKLNDIVNSNANNASNSCTRFNGFNITVAVCCNSINHNSVRNSAHVTYTFEITNERGYKMILNQHESTYPARASFELFADSLFRIKLSNLLTIFVDVDSIYEYLNSCDIFRGYKLV